VITGPINLFDITAQFRTSDKVRTAELLSRIADGDRAAWDEIFHRYGELVSATVRSFRMQEADALDAVQMTWLRLAENAHRVQFPERLGGWLATTARRECLHILRQHKPVSDLIDVTPDTVPDPSADPEQHVIEADIAQTLRKLIAELSPRRRALGRMLFTEDPHSYAEGTRTAGIPPGGIGPTRARALRQLRDRLSEYELKLEIETAEGNRTGSCLLDDLLDKADHALREKLHSKVTEPKADSAWSTGNAQLDNLLYKADAALRAALDDR
jgi:RNA polymerase sigma factor (sigma-70 family)